MLVLFGLLRFSTFLALVRLYVFFRLFGFGCSFRVFRVFGLSSIFLHSQSVAVSSVVVVARSGLPALADGGFFSCPKPDAPLSKTADPCRWGIDCQRAHVESGLLCGSHSVIVALRSSMPTLGLHLTKSLSRAHLQRLAIERALYSFAKFLKSLGFEKSSWGLFVSVTLCSPQMSSTIGIGGLPNGIPQISSHDHAPKHVSHRYGPLWFLRGFVHSIGQ